MSKIGTMPLQFSNANLRASVTLHLGGTVDLKSVPRKLSDRRGSGVSLPLTLSQGLVYPQPATPLQ